MRTLLLVAVLALAAPACSVADNATPEETARMEELAEEAANARAIGDLESADAADAEASGIESNIAARTVGAAWNLVAPFVPAPLIPFLPIVPALLFKRVRRTAAKALKEAAKVASNTIKGDFTQAGTAIGDAVDSALSIVGLKDSRNDTADDLQTWADEARAAGHTDLALQIEDRIDALKSGATV